jgi:hypothetical protein
LRFFHQSQDLLHILAHTPFQQSPSSPPCSLFPNITCIDQKDKNIIVLFVFAL